MKALGTASHAGIFAGVSIGFFAAMGLVIWGLTKRRNKSAKKRMEVISMKDLSERLDTTPDALDHPRFAANPMFWQVGTPTKQHGVGQQNRGS